MRWTTFERVVVHGYALVWITAGAIQVARGSYDACVGAGLVFVGLYSVGAGLWLRRRLRR